MDALAVAVIRSRRKPGAWVVGACCRYLRTAFPIIPTTAICGEVAEALAIDDHVTRCGRCSFAEMRGASVAERSY